MSVLSSASIIDAMARLSPKDATALASLAERVAMGRAAPSELDRRPAAERASEAAR